MKLSPATKDIVIRAAKTFIQTFIATLTVGGLSFGKDIVLAAFAAAVSATWNSALANK